MYIAGACREKTWSQSDNYMRLYFKTLWNYVYDIPLLSSLQRLFSDKRCISTKVCSQHQLHMDSSRWFLLNLVVLGSTLSIVC